MNRTPLVAGLLFLLAGAPSCAAPPAAGESEPERVGEAAAAITGNAVISNGQQWVDAQLHYCQAAHGAVDGDSSCWAWEGPSHRCDRESNAAWNAYRSDCSGFITWSWGLPPVGDGGYVTGDFAPFGTSFSKVIDAIDMVPGDAANLTAGGHIVLFKAWVTKGSKATFMEEPGCSISIPYAHEFTSTVSISGSSIYIDYEGESFTAIRYNSLSTAAPDWAASYVSQSWPLATTTMQMTVNQVVPATLTLKNVGAKTWDSSTRIGTTQPRDRVSPFAGADWLSTSRPAGIPAGTTVAPGQTFAFKFDFYAPAKPGTFDEFYGVLEEGVAWFSDPNEGGPPDDDLEAKIQVNEAEYHGQLVSQTFPTLQQAPIAMTVGQTLKGTITMKNIGTATWKAGVTKLAPTPRDKVSALGSGGWLSATRVSSPPADVAPGGSYAFPLELTAGTEGDFTQTFSLVEEAVTWFADAPMGGGPPDGLLAVHVVATKASSATGGGAGGADATGSGNGGGGAGGGATSTGDGGGTVTGDTGAGTSSGGPGDGSHESGTCAYRAPSTPDRGLAGAGWLAAIGAALTVARRRARRRRGAAQRQ